MKQHRTVFVKVLILQYEDKCRRKAKAIRTRIKTFLWKTGFELDLER